MYSNILLKVAMGVLVLTSIIGCSKEEEPYHEIARIELKGARCLSDSIKKIETFFAGKSTAKEVDAIWTCYSFALRTFDKYVQGENKNSYTSNELRNFLETYFLKEDLKKSRRTHIISDALLDEMMIIKRLFLGGSTNSLKKDELLKTLDLIVVFKKITEDLLPHSKLLFTSGSQTPPSEAEFKAAEQALSKASADLVSFLNQRTSRYEMANLNRLLNELHLFFRDLDPNSKFGKVHIYVPVIAKLKALLLNTNSFAIEASEWPAVGELLSQVAAIGLRAQYTFDVESLYSIEKLDLLERTSRMGLEIVKNSFSYRDHGAIAVSQFLDLIDELEAIDLLPLALTADDAKHMTSRFLDLVLNPEEKYPVSGLTLSKLGYLETEINGWAQVQKLMIRKEENDGNPFWRQMKMVLNSPFSLSLDTLERIVLDGDTAATNIEGATRLNWARAGLSMLFNAYIADPARRKTMNLSTKELHNAFIDLRPIFIGLDLIDKDDFIYDQSLFRDANLFMPRSDGDDYLSLIETIEYLHFVFAGISAGELFIADTNQGCRAGEKTMAVECFRNMFKSSSAKSLAHLPFYVQYSSTLSDNQWAKDIKNMERTNRKDGPTSDPILHSDIDETFVMLQYIEVIMLRFDEDRSGDLNIKEALKAFKHFKNVIGDMLGLDSRTESEEIEALFTYMLKYGDAPSLDDPLARMRFQNWKWQKKKWRLSAHRGTFLQILATLKGL